jgi:hypothetical protein
MGSTGSLSDWFSGIAGATTGLGILTFAFAPLAIPIVLLTVVAALPLALPLIAIAAIAAILTGTWRAIRAAARGIRRLGRVLERRHVTRGRTEATGPRPCVTDGRI